MTEHIKFDLPKTTLDYHRILRQALCKLVVECQRREARTDLKILDVGCGRGELLSELQSLGATVQGIDMEDQCVELSRQHAETKKGSIYELSKIYERNTFDIVIASHVLEHLPNPKEGIEMMKLVSRSYLIMAVPNLAELRNLQWFRKEPGLVNRGHHAGWDAAHFNTFLTHVCDLNVEIWQPDRVFFIPRRFNQVMDVIGLSSLRNRIQDNLLPGILPFQSHSLIVLCSLKS